MSLPIQTFGGGNYVNEGAFTGCANIQYCDLSGCTSLTTINKWIDVPVLKLPESVTTISSNQYDAVLGSRVTQLIIYATTPPIMAGKFAQDTFLTQGHIYVPDASVSAYKEAEGWSAYADIIKGISEIPND